jgi:hypothetical protein
LGKFEKLNRDEQKKYGNMKQNLLGYIRYLEELDDQFVEGTRSKRASTIEVKSDGGQQKVTDKFNKLVKMVGFIKNEALFSENDDDF